MADEKIPANGQPAGDVPEIAEEIAPEFGTKPTPEAAMGDLAGSADETLLLPKSGKIPYFFAYDHFLDQAIVARYVKGLIPAKVARASNYRLSWPYFYPPDGTALPSLQRSVNSSVWGLLYDARGVDFAKLDKHLNCPNRYHRRAVQVLDRGERRFSAFTYVLSVSDDGVHKPSASYLAHLVETAQSRGLPDEWLDTLKTLG
jgi:hypothetical protein